MHETGRKIEINLESACTLKIERVGHKQLSLAIPLSHTSWYFSQERGSLCLGR